MYTQMTPTFAKSFFDGQRRHGTGRPLLDTARILRDGALLSVVGSTYLVLMAALP